MTLRFPRLAVAAAALFALSALTGCETAPATGKTFFTGGLSAEKEAKLGFQEDKKVKKQFGGAYDDPALAAYIQSLGGFLAKTSEMPNLDFKFTVLDSPIVNAFALPGGYVYVTRGLLALAETEAQVAGVIGHEIGHVTARHTAQRYGQSILAQGAAVGAAILLGGEAAELFGAGANLALKSWSRDQEFEADTLGVRYMARSGFDTGAMAGFLSQLQAHSRLEAEIAGQPGKADEFSLLQTHPRTADRVQAAVRAAGIKPVAQPIVGRDVYLAKIDGMIYGDNPREGVIRGRRFLHPNLRFAFEVPEGFRLINSPEKVAAKGPGTSAIIFDRAEVDPADSVADYLTGTWAKGVDLTDVERIEIDRLPAATGQTSRRTRSGTLDFRLVAIRSDPRTVYRFLFVTAPEQTAALAEGLKRTTYSFRRLSPAEAKAVKPLRIRIHTVKAGETPTGLAKHMAFEKYQLERFLVLNGLRENSVLRPGQKVKLVTE